MSAATMEGHCRDIAGAVVAAANDSLRGDLLQFNILPAFDPEAT